MCKNPGEGESGSSYRVHSSIFSSFRCHLAGGRHGESDQDQRERPVGGWVQGQTRPLSLHPRPAAGTTPSRRRELRTAPPPPLPLHHFDRVQHTPSLSVVTSCSERKGFIQAHNIWTYELNPRRAGRSRLLSFWRVYTTVRLISVRLYKLRLWSRCVAHAAVVGPLLDYFSETNKLNIAIIKINGSLYRFSIYSPNIWLPITPELFNCFSVCLSEACSN